jgi:hypothetical protein
MLTSAEIHGINFVAWPVSLDGWDHLGSWNCPYDKIPSVRKHLLSHAILTLTATGVPVGHRQVAFRELPSSPGMCWVECACRDSRKSDSPP